MINIIKKLKIESIFKMKNMKKLKDLRELSGRAVLALVIIFAMVISIGIVSVNAVQGYIASENHEKRILVKYKDNGESDSVKVQLKNQTKNKLNLNKIETKKKYEQRNIELLEIGLNDDIDKVIKELKSNPNVLYAQPDYAVKSSSLPQDPKFGEEWGLSNTGQTVAGEPGTTGVVGTSGIDINALKAWDVTTGNSTTIVGVLDTGIDINHQDLKDNIFLNLNETKDNGIDENQNGYIDDVNGWNFADDNNSVFSSSVSDSHGTKVAGVIAAQLNDKGIAGVAPNIKLLPLKFMKGEVGYTSDAIEAIEYAKSLGIKIINCSWGSSEFNQALYDEMENSGILFICAAGNEGKDISKSGFYPAAYDLPNVISVAALNNQGGLLASSNYGKNVQVGAPGSGIITTAPGNTYEAASGTSIATPFVTGIAALINSIDSNVTAESIALRINNSVTPLDGLKKKVSSEGIVNAFGAINDSSVYYGKTNGKSKWSKKNPDGDITLYVQTVSDKLKEQIHYGEKGINPVTGNYSKSFTDMSVPSVGDGMDINIVRTYNSLNDETGSVLGRGWSFGYKGYIQTDSQNSLIKIVTLPNGSKCSFTNVGNDIYTANDSRNSLVFIPGDGLYSLKTQDQFTYGFNTSLYLTSITDRNGNTTTIDVNNANGRINFVKDNVGRQVTFAYNSLDLITSATDASGRTVLYEYDNNTQAQRIWLSEFQTI